MADKEKQIEEMAKVIFESSPLPEMWMSHARISAEVLYNEGWRKQSDDMVEVVRCKDCVNRVEFDTNKYHCELTGYYCGTMGYCSDGVRKEMKGGEG